MARRFIFVLLGVLLSARFSPAMVLSAAMLHPHKVALVTGANKGIGKEVARKLHAAGFTTVLGCRDPKLGDAAKHEILGTAKSPPDGGAGMVVCPLDLADAASIESCATFVEVPL